MKKRTKKLPLDLTCSERLVVEVLRHESRQSFDEIMTRAGMRYRCNMTRTLRYLLAAGIVDTESVGDGTERYSLAGVRG